VQRRISLQEVEIVNSELKISNSKSSATADQIKFQNFKIIENKKKYSKLLPLFLGGVRGGNGSWQSSPTNFP